MMSVTITTDTDHISLASPYNPDLSPLAKQLGGRWDPASRTWQFDVRDEQRVRELAVQVYGSDGSGDQQDLVSVRVPATAQGPFREEASRVVVAGRIVAQRIARDADVRLAEGVIIHSGKFASYAGSARYPAIGDNDVVLEVRDIPRPSAEREGLTIVDQAQDTRSALLAERDRLLSRLAQIEKDLSDDQGSDRPDGRA